jgi:hypothetical protein
MHSLSNEHLQVDLLDPVADRGRLGARFCGGGFIWQVHDRHAGPLFTGPEWPAENPDPFNGQGLPESFRHRTTTGAPLLWRGAVGLAPGAGALALAPNGNVVVAEPCVWETEVHRDRAAYRTRQSAAGWIYELVREVELRERQILSVSQLTNCDATALVLEWFAHPFFALSDGLARAVVPAGSQMEENPGFVLAGRELALRRPFITRDDSHLAHLVLPAGQELAASVSHPRLDHVRFAASFVPFKCVVWANSRTFSLEPFLALNLAPGETRRWTLRYEFGDPVPQHCAGRSGVAIVQPARQKK